MTPSSPAKIAAAIVDIDALIEESVKTKIPLTDDPRVSAILDQLTDEEAEKVRHLMLNMLILAGTVRTTSAIIGYIVDTTLREHEAIQPDIQSDEPTNS